MTAVFKQKEISTRERLNELDGLPAQVAQNTQALLPMGAYSGRNLIINGDFSVWQRGVSFAGVGFNADRWYVNALQAEIERVEYPDSIIGYAYKLIRYTNDHAVRFARTSVELPYAGACGVFHKGQQVTLSCKVKVSAEATFSPNFKFADNSQNSNAVDAAIFPVKPIPEVGVFVPMTFTTTITGEPLASNIAATTNIQIAAVSDLSIEVEFAEVQLELGSEATPFEIVDPATQLMRCQRYYWKTDLFFNMPFSRYNVSGGAVYATINYPTTMRVAPTVAVEEPFDDAAGFTGDLSPVYRGLGWVALTGAKTVGAASQVLYATDGTLSFDAEL